MDAQTVQNLLILIVLLFGILSIFLNWRHSQPSPPVAMPQIGGWQQLFEQCQREREREQNESERVVIELTTKLAVREREIELLRAELDRLLSVSRAAPGGVNISGGQTNIGRDLTGGDQTKRDEKTN